MAQGELQVDFAMLMPSELISKHYVSSRQSSFTFPRGSNFRKKIAEAKFLIACRDGKSIGTVQCNLAVCLFQGQMGARGLPGTQGSRGKRVRFSHFS